MRNMEWKAKAPTKRQAEVLDLALAGLSNPQIAERLGIARGTVKLHLQSCRVRMGDPMLGLRKRIGKVRKLEMEIEWLRAELAVATGKLG